MPVGHAAFTHPLAVLEIKRLLHEHVRHKTWMRAMSMKRFQMGSYLEYLRPDRVLH